VEAGLWFDEAEITPAASSVLTATAAFYGLRRGELCGLRGEAVDPDYGVLFVERNRTTAGYQVVEGAPKTAAGRRPVAMDKHTLQNIRAPSSEHRTIPPQLFHPCRG
jgi:integrase